MDPDSGHRPEHSDVAFCMWDEGTKWVVRHLIEKPIRPAR